MRYSVQAAAIATGVSESRLRTWERRYGVPLPARSESGRRWYEEADLAVVRRMAALVAAGIPASEAARGALTERAIDQLSPAGVAADPAVDALVAAAAALDAGRVESLVQVAAADGGGWAPAFDAMVVPALARMRAEWADGRLPLAAGRLTVEVVRVALAGAIASTPAPPRDAPRVLLVGPEDERCDLALWALGLALRERGLHVVTLGADLPAAELAGATETLRPAGVCIVAGGAGTGGALAHVARAVVGSRQPVQLFLGGAVVTSGDVPDSAPGVRLGGGVGAMADGIAQVLRGRPRARGRR